jgi:SAM-dependent methyltransferase
MTEPIDHETRLRQVREYYGQVLERSSDLETNACCATGAPPDWLGRLLDNVHEDVQARFYGCGFPIPEALEGATVVDLGCGTGRDVYVLSQLVGPRGTVHGVDMTEEQLRVARETLGWHMDRFGLREPNVAFHEGYIEDLSALPIEPASVDAIVSNCVVNLSPDKEQVLREAARVLKHGGELYLADVLADRRLPEDVARDPVVWGECLGGALYEADFVHLAKRLGFGDPRVVDRAPIEIASDPVRSKVGPARFSAVTLRLFKLPGLEPEHEDYGQVATYRGTAPHLPSRFTLDAHHVFETGRPARVCGNTADMLTETRFAPHFEVIGDKQTHYGAFDCADAWAVHARSSAPQSSGGGSCC